MAVGFQYTPQIESESFVKNTTYSLGAYQAKTPYKDLAGDQLNEFGIHFGLSFTDKAKRSNESFRWREVSKRRLKASFTAKTSSMTSLLPVVIVGAGLGGLMTANLLNADASCCFSRTSNVRSPRAAR